MNIFDKKSKQKVLDNLLALACENKSTNVSAIKLYLELAAAEQPDDTLTTEHAIEILRQAQNAATGEQQ
ncbi:hypothetical protein HUU59_10255 [bacterium]|nr:hypothetical protein [bacterium]